MVSPPYMGTRYFSLCLFQPGIGQSLFPALMEKGFRQIEDTSYRHATLRRPAPMDPTNDSSPLPSSPQRAETSPLHEGCSRLVHVDPRNRTKMIQDQLRNAITRDFRLLISLRNARLVEHGGAFAASGPACNKGHCKGYKRREVSRTPKDHS